MEWIITGACGLRKSRMDVGEHAGVSSVLLKLTLMTDNRSGNPDRALLLLILIDLQRRLRKLFLLRRLGIYDSKVRGASRWVNPCFRSD